MDFYDNFNNFQLLLDAAELLVESQGSRRLESHQIPTAPAVQSEGIDDCQIIPTSTLPACLSVACYEEVEASHTLPFEKCPTSSSSRHQSFRSSVDSMTSLEPSFREIFSSTPLYSGEPRAESHSSNQIAPSSCFERNTSAAYPKEDRNSSSPKQYDHGLDITPMRAFVPIYGKRIAIDSTPGTSSAGRVDCLTSEETSSHNNTLTMHGKRFTPDSALDLRILKKKYIDRASFTVPPAEPRSTSSVKNNSIISSNHGDQHSFTPPQAHIPMNRHLIGVQSRSSLNERLSCSLNERLSCSLNERLGNSRDLEGYHPINNSSKTNPVLPSATDRHSRSDGNTSRSKQVYSNPRYLPMTPPQPRTPVYRKCIGVGSSSGSDISGSMAGRFGNKTDLRRFRSDVSISSRRDLGHHPKNSTLRTTPGTLPTGRGHHSRSDDNTSKSKQTDSNPRNLPITPPRARTPVYRKSIGVCSSSISDINSSVTRRLDASVTSSCELGQRTEDCSGHLSISVHRKSSPTNPSAENNSISSSRFDSLIATNHSASCLASYATSTDSSGTYSAATEKVSGGQQPDSNSAAEKVSDDQQSDRNPDKEDDTDPELGDLDDEAKEVCIGDVTMMDEFIVHEYFEKYHNRTLLSDGEDDDVLLNENIPNKETGPQKNTSHDKHSSAPNLSGQPQGLPADLGFKELENDVEKRKTVNHRKINRIAKIKGDQYKRSNGTVVAARKVQAPCSCVQLKCFEKYGNEIRTQLLENLLKLTLSGQNQFFSNHMAIRTTARPTVLNSRRIYTRSYYLPAVNGRIRVCKEMFMRTFDVTDKKLRVLAAKQLQGLGISADDLRSTNESNKKISAEHIQYIENHIRSFPAYTSHYARERTSKLYLSSDLSVLKMYQLYEKKCAEEGLPSVRYNTYRIIFKRQNLSFRKPKADTCCVCDKYAIRMKLAKDDADKSEILSLREKHHTEARLVYDQKKGDIQAAKSNPEIRTVSFDLQKCLPTPHLQCGIAYYMRQLYTLNLTVFATHLGVNNVDCYMWDESKGRRGSQEIGSCLLQDLCKTPSTVKIINYFSDRCAGQNHNVILCMMFSYFITLCSNANRELTIKHTFMISGHSHMEVDSAHACIERAKKRFTANIETPRDWAIFIATINRKIPFNVTEMEQADFVALKQLDAYYKRPKHNSCGETIRFKDVSLFEYRTSSPGVVFYKYSLCEETFSSFDMKIAPLDPTLSLPPISTEPIPLSKEKLQDLKKLMDFVTNKVYYQTLLKQLVPKKRGRKSKHDEVVDHFEADMDHDDDGNDNIEDNMEEGD